MPRVLRREPTDRLLANPLAAAALIAVAVGLLANCNGNAELVLDAVSSAPPMTHGPPNEAARQMCVVCHTCGSDGTIATEAPIIGRTHPVCNACHGPDGGIVVHGEQSCEWEMDCNVVPPLVNCDDCHTVEYVNDLCEECH